MQRKTINCVKNTREYKICIIFSFLCLQISLNWFLNLFAALIIAMFMWSPALLLLQDPLHYISLAPPKLLLLLEESVPIMVLSIPELKLLFNKPSIINSTVDALSFACCSSKIFVFLHFLLIYSNFCFLLFLYLLLSLLFLLPMSY